jgi:hypothetical protein
MSKTIAICAVLLASFWFRVQSARAQMLEYQTKYYTIYTDIDPQEEKEAEIRMTRMAEEYHERTKGFSGQIRSRLPFYLFRSAADYYAAGGTKGSAGVFKYVGNDAKLMAIAGQKSSQDTWHIVQHEGFHQFAHMAIGGNMPTWLNEGLAEYFGESIWTGDGFVTGIIPPWRLSRLKNELQENELHSLNQIALISPQAWQDQLNIRNYDQAWSIVHFLVHADDQKYQASLSNCIRAIAQGRDPQQAMRDTIAQNAGLEDRWKSWWSQQPPSPTSALYDQAAVETMTSFVARAFEHKQIFPDFDAFRTAVNSKTLNITADDWLPDSLIQDTFRLHGDQPGWAITVGANKQPEVSLTRDDGTRIVGYFVLQSKRVDHVYITLDDMAVVLKNAQTLPDANKKSQARQMVQNAMKLNPRSAMIAEAKQFLLACR